MEITRRELDILKFLAAGYSSAQVANILGVTYSSVTNQLESVSSKLERSHGERQVLGSDTRFESGISRIESRQMRS